MKSFKPKGFTMITTLKAFNESRINENINNLSAKEMMAFLTTKEADEWWKSIDLDTEEISNVEFENEDFADWLDDDNMYFQDEFEKNPDKYFNDVKIVYDYYKKHMPNTTNEGNRKYYDRTNFSKYPYQMYFSDNGMADAVGADTIAELIDNVAKKRNLKAFAIFKADRGFHSTADEKYLTLWYDTTGHDFWTNRAVKEPELNKKKIDSLDTFYTKFDRNGKPKMPMNEALGKGMIRVFKKKEMKEYIKDVKKSDITKRSMDKIVKADNSSDNYKVNYVTLKDGTKGYVWSENQKLD